MELLFVFGFQLLSAFFSGSETAFVSINRLKLHSKLDDGDKKARVLEKLIKKSENVIGTFLIGSNISDVSTTIFFTLFLEKILGNNHFLIPIIVMLVLTPIITIFGTLIPKVIFREFADSIMYRMAYFYFVLYWLLFPFQFVLVHSIKLLLGILGFRKRGGNVSKAEFNVLLDMSTEKGVLKESEKDFIKSIMNFKNVKAREIMIPLVQMTCAEENDTVEIASALMMTTKHARIPVFRMRVDNMIGYIENKAIINSNKHDPVGKYIKPGVFVPDSASIKTVLVLMQEKLAQMAFVVDEYGGVIGIITNQDVVTEIIGDLVEIHENWFQKLPDYYLVNGRYDFDELNEKLGLKVLNPEFETVAGFVLSRLERIPEVGESFDEDKYTFEVSGVSHARIKEIKIYPKKKRDKKEKKRGEAEHE